MDLGIGCSNTGGARLKGNGFYLPGGVRILVFRFKFDRFAGLMVWYCSQIVKQFAVRVIIGNLNGFRGRGCLMPCLVESGFKGVYISSGAMGGLRADWVRGMV